MKNTKIVLFVVCCAVMWSVVPVAICADEDDGGVDLPLDVPLDIPLEEPEIEAVDTRAIPPAKVEGGVEVNMLVNALQKKEQELIAARKEIVRLKKALASVQQLSKKELVGLYYNKGCIYKASKHYRYAEVNFLKALDIDPSDAGVHYNLAILYDDDLKDSKKAKLHYERFLELAPGDPDAPRVREWLMAVQ